MLHSTRLALAAVLCCAAAPLAAQSEGTLFDISQTAIGSNGFGTHWRGQDVEIADDAWLTRIRFETGSASANVDEIRLMTATPGPTTLRAETNVVQHSANEVEVVLGEPYLLRGGTRYTIWFHQSGTPRGTYGCDLTRVDPSWAAYHTDVDPTQAPATGEPTVWWGYRYGTNMTLVGYDNYDLTGNPTLGGFVDCTLQVQPQDLCGVFFALRPWDTRYWIFRGPLRLDPTALVPVGVVGSADGRGGFVVNIPIPNQPVLRGVTIHSQAVYDPTFNTTATFSPLDSTTIQ